MSFLVKKLLGDCWPSPISMYDVFLANVDTLAELIYKYTKVCGLFNLLEVGQGFF